MNVIVKSVNANNMKRINLILILLALPIFVWGQSNGGEITRKETSTNISAKRDAPVVNRLNLSQDFWNDFLFIESGTLSKDGKNAQIESFWISSKLVTQKLWTEIMGYNPSSYKDENAPVDNVSWNECQGFITKLNKMSKKTFRLPSNGEWGYAATKGIKGEIWEWTTSPHCYSNNSGYGKYSITRCAKYKDQTTATRSLTTKENELGFRLALNKDEYKR